MRREQFSGVSCAAPERLTGKKARHFAGEDTDRLHAETPYGPIGKVLRFGEEAVPYICPLALLWTMASASMGSACFCWLDSAALRVTSSYISTTYGLAMLCGLTQGACVIASCGPWPDIRVGMPRE